MTAILLVLARLAFSALSIVLSRFHRTIMVAAHAVDASLIAILALQLHAYGEQQVVLGPWTSATAISFSVDRIGVTFAALAFALSLAVLLYSWRDSLRPYVFMLLHILIGSCYALALTKDLFNAYVLFELVTLASFLLVGYERQIRQIWASLRYLILSSFGMSLFLFGIAVLYFHTGSLHLDTIAQTVAAHIDSPWVTLSAALLVTGIAVKAGVFLFSLWLPDAHSEAPPIVSALLSGLVIKMGVVELFRLSSVFPLERALLVLGFATAFLGLVYAIHAQRIKRMLAFHTLSQIGYLLIGFGVGTEEARLGTLDYAVAHGLFKSLLFLVVGEMAALAGSDRLDRLIAHRSDFSRLSQATLAVAALGILGLPPLAGFAAKAALEAGIHSSAVHAALALVSVGTAASFAKLLPLFASSSARKTPPARSLAYAWLAAAIVFFLPVSRLMLPLPVWASALAPLAFAEALAAVLLGFLLHHALRRSRFRLPQTIFRLEEALVVVLTSFFLVWLTVPAG